MNTLRTSYLGLLIFIIVASRIPLGSKGSFGEILLLLFFALFALIGTVTDYLITSYKFTSRFVSPNGQSVYTKISRLIPITLPLLVLSYFWRPLLRAYLSLVLGHLS